MAKHTRAPESVKMVAFRHKKKVDETTVATNAEVMSWLKNAYANHGALFITLEFTVKE